MGRSVTILFVFPELNADLCPPTVVAEVFPLGLRAKGVSIGASSNWLNNFAVGMSTPDFVTAAPYGVYIFLGLMCVLGTLYVFFFVPETKNRTLDEMDELFGDKTGRSKAESAVLLSAMRDVGLLRAAGIEDKVHVEDEKHDDTHHEKADTNHSE